MREIWTLASKDIRLLLRDRAGAFFSLGFPLVYAIFFGFIFGGAGGSGGGVSRVPIAIVDLDGSSASAGLVERIGSSSAVRVETMAGEGETLDGEATLERARDRLRAGRLAAAVVVPEGFGERMAMPFVGGGAELQLLIDPARQAERGVLQGVVLEAGYRQFQQVFTDPSRLREVAARGIESIDAADADERARLAPLRLFLSALGAFGGSFAGGADGDGGSALGEAFESAFQPVALDVSEVLPEGRTKNNAFAITFPQAILWGLMGTSFGFALSLVIERREGTLTRLRVAPVPAYTVIAGKALAAFIMMIAVTTLLLVVVRLVFGVVPTSTPLLVVSVCIVGFAFVGAMMLIASSGKTESQVSGIGWGSMIVLAMIGGAMVPRIAMPEWLQSVGMVSPIRWGIDAIEGPLWRGLGPADLWLSWVLLLALGCVGLLLGSRAFDRQSA